LVVPERGDVGGRELLAAREHPDRVARQHPEQEEVEGQHEPQGHQGLQAFAEQVPP